MQMRKTNPAAQLRRRACLHAVGAAFVVLAGTMSRVCAEQPFPSKPITLIVPGGPGGALDLAARALTEQVGITLGQPMILDHKPGGTQTLGPATMAASAKADGHMLSLFASTIVRVP